MSVNSVQQFLNVRDSHLRVVSGNVHADQMVLGGITVDTSHGLQSVTNTSNVTTNTVEFSNTTTAFVTTANVEVGGELTVSGNVEVGGELTVTANAEIGGDLTVSGNTFYSNNTSIHIDSNVVAEFTGPHGRDGAAVLKKYPEIAFESGKFDSNESTNTYVQAGYTVTSSSHENQILRSRGLTGDQGYDMNTSVQDLFNADGGTHGIRGMQQTAHGVSTSRDLVRTAPDNVAGQIPSGYNPKSSPGALTPTGTRSYWADLGRDTLDEWGMWYIFNPADQTASHIQFSAVNGTTGTVYIDPQIHHGKTFIVKHGWVAQGIFKLDVECEDPTFSFSIGMYGNMGSDSTTENLDKQYAAPWGTLNYNFNRTNSGGAVNTDPFYTHLIPKQRSFNDATATSGTNFTSKLNTSTRGSDGDFLAIWFDTLQVGATMYFVIGASGNITTSAMFDWVANDITGEQSAWHVFDEITPESSWSSKSGTYYDGTSPTNSYTGTTHQLGTGTAYGEWLKVKLSHRIKVTKFILYADDINEAPKSYKIYGSVTGSSWTELKDVSNETPSIYGNSHEITDTEGYRYIAIVVTQVNSDQGNVRIGEIKLYGYENFEGGDTSVDTTFTSIMNTPQISGVEVYVDGSLGETFTNRVAGPTVSNTHTTYVSAEKYWELSGNVESNVTLEANTFLSGDAPHSLSMWFNSSNLVSNASNSCIFSLGTEERLDHVSAAFSNNYQTVQKLLPRDLEAGDRFGFAVAMNSDGTKFIVGAYQEHAGDNSDAGAAYIFTYNSDTGNWDERKLVSPDIEAAAQFGISVGMNSDGTKVIVGAFEEHAGGISDAGAAYIFTYSSGSWDFGTKIVAPDKEASDKFGYSAAMSGDGTKVIVGAYVEDHDVSGGDTKSSAGSAYIFTYDGSSWGTGAKIVASDRTVSDIFGRSVAMNSDGTKAIVGADNGRAAYIFTYNGSNWVQQQILVASGGATAERFGYAVAMNPNGTKVIVGAYAEDVGGTNETGSAYIYTYDGSNWDTGTKIVAPDKEAGDRFGVGVAINSDGNRVTVAAYQEHANGVDNAGAAYIFAYDGSNWDTGLKITAPDKAVDDSFSSDKQGVAMSGDGARVIVGAYHDDDNGSSSGSVYVYDRDTTHHLTTDLKLQSNTWHNLTYAYQGEGGSRVTYLDGRKVSEDQAEDTFGEYPPFDMTGFSQGGYVVSATNYDSTYYPWTAFDGRRGNIGEGWFTEGGFYTGSEIAGMQAAGLAATEFPVGTGRRGEYLDLEMPHKIRVSYFVIQTRTVNAGQIEKGSPHEGYLYGSNDGVNWAEIKFFSGLTYGGITGNTTEDTVTVNSTTAYKYLRLQATKRGAAFGSDSYVGIGELKYYGHRENDLVRLPDPTNVLKYPHIAMTGPSQRGYVASASDFNTSYPAWEAFDDKYTDLSSTATPSPHVFDRWQPNGGYATSGTPRNADGNETTTLASGSSPPDYDGDWLQLESPNKVNIKSYRLYNSTDYVTDYNAHTVVLLGSNTGINDWVDIGSGETVLSWSPNTSTANGSHVSTVAIVNTSGNTGFYKYHRLVVTKVTAQNLPVIYQLQLFGTEEATPVPIQIGGGNIDKVANFRVYDKFVGEDQALEIWDAQKDEFGRAKSSMTLQKGRLGLGTTEPEGRLAVLDEPHAPEEFPPRAGGFDGDEWYIEGHGTFKACTSNYHSDTLYYPGRAFTKSLVVNVGFATLSDSGIARWSGNNGLPNQSSSDPVGTFQGHQGDWLELELPYRIRVESFQIQTRLLSRSPGDHPKNGFLYGSNNRNNWTQITEFTNLSYTPSQLDGIGAHKAGWNVNSDSGFKYLRLLTTQKIDGSNPWLMISELSYFGTREQGQSVLHDGELTLTKNLNVPRIGPALDADDTPRRDRLVVEYNTSTNPTFEGAVRDTSGRGLDGVFYGGASYDANEKALVFDGTTDYIMGRLGNAGDIDFTVSLWVKKNTSGTVGLLWNFGGSGGTGNPEDSVALEVGSGNNLDYFIFSGAQGAVTNFGTNYAGKWVHVVATRSGNNLKIYFDGVDQNMSITGTDTLQLAPNSEFTIGARGTGALGNNSLNGSISNFKIYDVVLTAEEVKTLYNMGRCDEGHHVVNFSKTRVGIGLGDGEAPTYTLDVRGQIRSDGSLVTSFTGQHKCIPDEPMEKGLIVSAKKNQFVKLNGLAIGKSAITIDESLPIVSLSNVVQDKACFGVVSSIEEVNTTFRVETTNGGVISTIPKTLGDNRAIVNSVGEGAIWVVDTGGSLESGDYITTSNVTGYGQKQNDDVLHNYTVAKITMDCDFTGSNVAVQTIKRKDIGLRTIMEDTWNKLVDYDRSSNTETQYSNTLVSSAYADQPGYVPREVTTIVDYTDGSNIVSIAEWSNLESNIQNTYQSNTFTEIVDYTKFVSLGEWSNLTPETQNTYSEDEITTYYQIQRGENVLDENGQLQFEDKTGATEAPYERRFLDASGVETDSANAVHIAAFVGCTYHCG